MDEQEQIFTKTKGTIDDSADDSRKPETVPEGKEQTPDNEKVQELSVEEKIRMFGKNEEKLQNEIKDLNDRLLRKIAEMENYRKRTETEKINLMKYGERDLIVDLLPVIDDFERSIKLISDAKDIDAVKRGVELIYGKMMKVVENHKVVKIHAKGETFDIDFHEAVMQMPNASVPASTVLEELETGYVYKDRVIRHTKVIVSSEPEKQGAEGKKE